MKPTTWMPFYVGDYLRDTMHLTTTAHGAYLLLLFAYWTNGPLLDDDEYLSSITKLDRHEWNQMRPTMEAFFYIEDHLWHHKRVDEEREKACSLINSRSQGGKIGMARRWGTIHDNSVNNSVNNSTVTPPITKPLQEHIPSPSHVQRERVDKNGNPTMEEVQLAFAKAGGPESEALKFFNWYSANGWKVGKNRMKSMPHAAAGWVTRWREDQSKQSRRPLTPPI